MLPQCSQEKDVLKAQNSIANIFGHGQAQGQGQGMIFALSELVRGKESITSQTVQNKSL